MTEFDKPLAGVTVMIIDMSDTASSVVEGFAAAGADVVLAHDEVSLAKAELEALPNVVIIYPGSLEFRRIRLFANELLDQKCVSILYDDQFPADDEHYYKDPYTIYRARPVEDVVAAAMIGLQKISTAH